MNIFSSLAQGNGRLTETNLSAFLAFLLNPHEAHGLSDTFLKLFLRTVANTSGDEQRYKTLFTQTKIDATISLEIQYPSRRVDIEIKLFEKDGTDESRESHRLIIENKVRTTAAEPKQFVEEFDCVKKAIEHGTLITAIFLTPDSSSSVLSDEYNMLALKNGPDRKAWLKWNNRRQDSANSSIVDLIREMLRQEAMAEIEPVSEYTRHTLKAFVQFIEDLLSSSTTRVATDQEKSEIDDEIDASIDGKRFRLVRYINHAIKIFDEEGNEHEAKSLLRILNQEQNLGVELNYKSGTLRNTRALGRDIIRKLRDKKTAPQSRRDGRK